MFQNINFLKDITAIIGNLEVQSNIWQSETIKSSSNI